jgi:acetyl-CoA C-acetyltransferase
LADLAPAAAAATGVVDVADQLDGYAGEATVVTYTVTYEGADPVRAVAVCDTPEGPRCVAFTDDPAVAAHGLIHELCGTRVVVANGTFALA